MCRAGLAGDVHSRELTFPLCFFFLNKKLGFCQHRFLQKTSNFPENKKKLAVFFIREHTWKRELEMEASTTKRVLQQNQPEMAPQQFVNFFN